MATLAGTALVLNEGPASKVFVWDWESGELVGYSEPNAAGFWTITIPSGVYGVTIRGVIGVSPSSHGPYEV